MVEALAVVAVFFIAIIIYIGMWLQARDPALSKPHEELVRIHHQMRWLDERLAKARREGWGDAMTANIVAEREATARLLKNSAGAGAVTAAAGAVALSGRKVIG